MAIVLRKMRASDISGGLMLSQQMGWPHRREDWMCAFTLGEGIVAEVEGELCGTTLCWRWGQHHATIGLVLVAKQLQGKGLGKKLFAAQLERLGSRTIQLYATPAGEPLYRKFGFRPAGFLQQWHAHALPAVASSGIGISAATVADISQLALLDGKAWGAKRECLIRWLLANAHLAVIRNSQEQICAWAACRRMGRGYVIGPVVASRSDHAQALCASFLTTLAGEFVRLDCPEGQHESFTHWLGQNGFTLADRPLAMVKGDICRHSYDVRLFSLMSQAMG